ncbi:MAG: NADH-quinone oxidoreductase subunit H [Elusimicrobiota bacterium]
MIDYLNAVLAGIFNTYRKEIYYIVETLIKIVFFYGFVMSFAGILTIAERKISALIQDRIGPNRANIFKFTLWGLFHPIADGIKMIMKEDFVPKNASKILFTIAPVISIFPVLFVIAFIPFGNYLDIGSYRINLAIIDSDFSFFLLVAIISIAIYGVFLGGFCSGNNWGLLGAIRAQAQMISYEIILVLSVLPLIMVYSAGGLKDIVIKQSQMFAGFIPQWGIFLQPVSFIIFFTAVLAEIKRTPFDVVEGESEIIGYFIECGSMRFGAFMFAEYIEIILFSMLISIFFFGGWHIPYLSEYGFKLGPFFLELNHYLVVFLQLTSFIIKTIFFSIMIIIIRWTLPRFRFDQIMKLCWKNLLLLSILNLLITAIVIKKVI